MNDEQLINRMLHDYGTSGLAELIASVCRDNAKTDEEPGMEEFWNSEANRFESGFTLPFPSNP